MKFIPTGFEGLQLIEIEPLEDARGFFARTYCKNEFARNDISTEFVQMNLSYNEKQGTLRGMHFQVPPHEEIKLIRCNSGRVFDVVVDLRKQSDTYLKWFGVELSRDNMKMILIPGGFAHGFITLEDHSELIYHHSAFYNPTFEGGLRYDDPVLNIQWPMAVSVVSEKDKNHPLLKKQ